MPVTKLSELLAIDKGELTDRVRSGKYLPQAILGVEIPKGKGKTRLLGIPTVTDRLLQQAVLQIITARFEYEFSDSSITVIDNADSDFSSGNGENEVFQDNMIKSLNIRRLDGYEEYETLEDEEN